MKKCICAVSSESIQNKNIMTYSDKVILHLAPTFRVWNTSNVQCYLHSKRVNFEYGVVSAVYTRQTCMSGKQTDIANSRVIIVGCTLLWCDLSMRKCAEKVSSHIACKYDFTRHKALQDRSQDALVAGIMYRSRERQISTQLSFRNLPSTSLFANLNLACPLCIIAVHCYYLVVIALK